ncbi:MAG: CDP-glucose 4,6-dehydratase [Longimicrobiaceae bacterium]
MIEHGFGGVFQGRRVFLTGHTGFKGSWLALWLAELGAEVHGYALAPPTQPSLFAEAGIESRLASHRIADVRDAPALARALREIQPELVFHLAAQPLVRYSYAEPRETYEANVMGTVNLLEAVRGVDTVRVCQVVTTDKCYENREWVYAYRENDALGGYDPYSSSKACAELVVSAYRRSFFPPEHRVSLASARAGNVIGGGDWALDRIIPDCIRALEAERSIPVRNPQAVRPWQHVLEPLSGYLLLAARQWEEPARFADAWNFGPTAAGHLTVRELLELLLAEWGEGEWETPDTERAAPHEAGFLKLDITKANSLLGWYPVYDAAEAVRASVEWYRERYDSGAAVAEMCVRQIEAYSECARQAGLPWAAPVPAAV